MQYSTIIVIISAKINHVSANSSSEIFMNIISSKKSIYIL